MKSKAMREKHIGITAINEAEKKKKEEPIA
jgi:hypothetical protein